MPNRAIEIHDSILKSVRISASTAELHFSYVYIHQSEGTPGADPGSGWAQQALIRIDDAQVEGHFSEFPVDLTCGQTQMGEDIFKNLIPIPLRYKGVFALRLDSMWRPNEIVSFRGSSVELELIGQPEYVEEFPGGQNQ
jgi:hypothetical protein